MVTDEALILVFAKAPVAGKVKTRLIPAVGEQAANSIHRSLLLYTVQNMVQAPVVPVQLWCAPEVEHELFGYLAQKYGVSLHQQQGRCLGERMQSALRQALSVVRKVVIVGCDSPVLTKSHIMEMLQALDSFDATIIPASDGGYVALGLRCIDDSLFTNIDWGTEVVLGQTLNRLDRLGWRYKLQESLWDIDRPEDLEKLLSADRQGGANTSASAPLLNIFDPALQQALQVKLENL